MPLTINYKEIENVTFDYPFRIIISGSSQSGKTSFSKRLLQQTDLFNKQFKSILYCYPEYLTETPVQWHSDLQTSVTYQTGLPSLEELCSLESDSVIVLDDLYEECIIAKQIDYLFRVLSGKIRLNVIIMTQRFFAQGRFAMNIRNCCNFTVLMRNSDERLNSRIANLFKASSAITKIIEKEFSRDGYPYIFVDSSPKGQITGYRLYTNIFNRYVEVYDRAGMKGFIIREKDFYKNFEIINKTTAKRNGGNEKQNVREFASNSEEAITGAKSEGHFATKICERTRKLRRKRLRKNLQ